MSVSLFNKTAGLQFYKQRLPHKCISVNLAESFKASFFLQRFWAAASGKSTSFYDNV